FDKKDHLLFLEGKVIIKNLKKDEPDLNLLIEEFYNGNYQVEEIVEDKHLGRMKIALSWLVQNRNNARIFYLKDFKSVEELYEKATVSD
ncbi:MAG: hypothetical protein ABFS12_07310, partial [Bacteroidota bacterium]